ncbi:MAG: alpha/beta hydrolase [Lachnospiraceae bacterium]|nr:alpha/beta hydrolase [Lachnospiraceae bacterium]
MAKKGGFLFLSAAAALAGAGVFAGSRLYKDTIIPKARAEEEPDASELVTKGRFFVRNHPGHQDVWLDAIDLIKLHAVYIEAKEQESHSYAILVHGIHDQSEGMGIYAEHYLDQGVHVLLPDLRGYGKSEGSYTGYGLDDRLDIMEWIYWILRRDPKARIALHGVSMGAATVLMTAGEHLPAGVLAVIADSAYSDLRDEFAHVYATSPKSILPFPAAFELLRAQTKARAGYDLDDVSPVRAVARAKTPILYLHGDADRLIPVSMSTKLYEETPGKRKLATFRGADHIRGILTDPEGYWEQVDGFLKEVSFF